jgi:peptide-methionine (S)-S-oxide reductase
MCRFLEAKQAANPGMKIVTELEAVKNYYKAEDYHQQYLARGGRFGRAQNPGKGCNDPIRCYG